MDEIEKEICNFSKKSGWFRTKDVIAAIYQNFKSRYPSRETFRRLVLRRLRKLAEADELIKHRHEKYYHYKMFRPEEIKQTRDFLETNDLMGYLPFSKIIMLNPSEIPVTEDVFSKEEMKAKRAEHRARVKQAKTSAAK